jgi:hypothetical protein
MGMEYEVADGVGMMFDRQRLRQHDVAGQSADFD